MQLQITDLVPSNFTKHCTIRHAGEMVFVQITHAKKYPMAGLDLVIPGRTITYYTNEDATNNFPIEC